jgi:integrase
MLTEAATLRNKNMYSPLVVDLNLNYGLRDKELRQLRWQRIDLVHKKALTVGKSENRGWHRARDPAERNGHCRLEGTRRLVRPAI